MHLLLENKEFWMVTFGSCCNTWVETTVCCGADRGGDPSTQVMLPSSAYACRGVMIALQRPPV
jgi:hypothetical protein